MSALNQQPGSVAALGLLVNLPRPPLLFSLSDDDSEKGLPETAQSAPVSEGSAQPGNLVRPLAVLLMALLVLAIVFMALMALAMLYMALVIRTAPLTAQSALFSEGVTQPGTLARTLAVPPLALMVALIIF